MTDLLEIEALKAIEGLTQEQINEKIIYRGIDHKYDDKIEDLITCYRRKIPFIQKELIRLACAKVSPEVFPEMDTSQEQLLTEKLARLKEKYACCLKEKEYRKDKLVSRRLHGTAYYIDLDGGDDAKDGESTANAWKTIEKYTTVTGRSAGDIAYVRANTDETPAADVAFDEDGDPNNRIKIIGCDAVTNDPWSDADDTEPLIDYGGNARQFVLYTDFGWEINRIDFTASSDTYGAILFNVCGNNLIDSCNFSDMSNSYGCRAVDRVDVEFSNCSWSNCGTTASVIVYSCLAFFDSCTFNGGAGNAPNYGIRVYRQGIVYMKDTTIGSTTAFANDSISLEEDSKVYARNCLLSDASEINFVSSYGVYFNEFFSEDHDQVAGASYYSSDAGIAEKDTSVEINSLPTVKLSPSSICGADIPLTLCGKTHSFLVGDYRIWNESTDELTVTIKAKETAAWTADPGATDFYFEASYLDGVSGQSRSTQASAQSLDGTNEVSFTMTFTPNAAGYIYVTCYCKDYENGKYIQVGILPVVS